MASEQPSLRITCVNCRKTIKAPASMASKYFMCPACGTKLRAPDLPDDDGPQEYGFKNEAAEEKPRSGKADAAARGLLPKRDTRVPPPGFVLPQEEEPEPKRVGKTGFGESMRRLVSGGADLHSAARNGDLEAVKGFLAKGADVDEPDRSGRTPLFFAAEQGYQTIARVLIKQGADVNARKNKSNPAPLHAAVLNDRQALTFYLLTKGADLEATSPEGTPLHVAVSARHHELAGRLMAWGAKVNAGCAFHLPMATNAANWHVQIPESRVCEDWSILHSAAWLGDCAMAKLLLEHGADPNGGTRLQPSSSRPQDGSLQMYPIDVAILNLAMHAGDDGHEKTIVMIGRFGGNFARFARHADGVGRSLLIDSGRTELLEKVKHAPVLFSAKCPSCRKPLPVRSKATQGQRVACWYCDSEFLAEPQAAVSPY